MSEDKRKGGWMQTYTGIQFWPVDPRPQDIHIEDIAHALSNVCRYNGHCQKFYSVAEHSVYVSRLVPEDLALWGLLHDASEAYIGDMVRPAKQYVEGYSAVEAKLMDAVCEAYGLTPYMPAAVKKADNMILADEASQIMGRAPVMWDLPEKPSGTVIQCLPPEQAKQLFLERAKVLFYD